MSIFVLRNFNVDFLNYNKHNQTIEFEDSFASKTPIPLILQPTRIASHSNTVCINSQLIRQYCKE